MCMVVTNKFQVYIRSNCIAFIDIEYSRDYRNSFWYCGENNNNNNKHRCVWSIQVDRNMAKKFNKNQGVQASYISHSLTPLFIPLPFFLSYHQTWLFNPGLNQKHHTLSCYSDIHALLSLYSQIKLCSWANWISLHRRMPIKVKESFIFCLPYIPMAPKRP